MNELYDHLVKAQVDMVLHLEDDWICHHDEDPSTHPWFDDCCWYLHMHPEVSTLFLRKYVSDEDKRMYGWTRNIPYVCFQHPNPFHYAEKIKDQPKIPFRSLTFRRIPEFLYSANPTLFRLKHYLDRKVFPFPEFQDATMRQDAWATTTMEDAPQWGFAEALAMEKIRDLICMNVDHGYFYHASSTKNNDFNG